MKLTTDDGKEYEWRGDAWFTREGNLALNAITILHPITRTITIGGVVWELGKKRRAERGEWYVGTGTPIWWPNDSNFDATFEKHQIIRPLRVEGQA